MKAIFLFLLVPLIALGQFARMDRTKQAVLPAGRTLYWTFDDQTLKAGRVLNATPGVYDGVTTNDVRIVAGPGGMRQALEFSGIGTNNIAVMTNGNNGGNTRFTVLCWAKPYRLSRGDIVSQWFAQSAGSRFDLLMGVTSAKAQFYIAEINNTTKNTSPSTTTMVTNQWYFLGGRVTDTGMDLIVNGVVEQTLSLNPTPRSSGLLPIMVGNDSFNDAQFAGSIDEVMVYDRALSNDEITLIYNATRPR